MIGVRRLTVKGSAQEPPGDLYVYLPPNQSLFR
jgi:hypothetical protein